MTHHLVGMSRQYLLCSINVFDNDVTLDPYNISSFGVVTPIFYLSSTRHSQFPHKWLGQLLNYLSFYKIC